MKKEPVESSNIEWVGYEPNDKALFVGFHSGKSYKYTPVTQVGYNNFRAAKSLGSYFFHHIKDNPTISCEEVDL